MNAHLLLILGLVALLVSCDEPKKARDSESIRKPRQRVARTHRPTPEDATNSNQELQKSLVEAIGMESTEARDKAFSAVAWNAIGRAPDIAVRALEQMSIDSPERAPLIQWYVMRLMKQSPDDAIAWAEALGSKSETAVAKEQIVQVLAKSDPERAAKLLMKSGSAIDKMNGTQLFVLQRWIADSPTAAAEWVGRFPAGEARDAAVKTVVSDWTQADPQAAFAWVATPKSKSIQREATQALLEVFIAQPEFIRELWLEYAQSSIRTELLRQHDQLMEESKEVAPE
jgi:hypothetical protein